MLSFESKLIKLILSLAVLATAATAAEKMDGYFVNLAVNNTLGTYLVNQTGFTLYHFAQDIPGDSASNCYGKCAGIWPPFYAENLTVAKGLNATDFKAFTRTDGKKQIAYKGWPLYLFSKDTDPKDTYGQGFNKVWFVVNISALNNKQPIPQMPSNQTCISESQVDLTLKMRELWAEHVIWTRMFIMSVADNTTDKAVVTQRLLKNYDDLADAMTPYYGNDTGNKFGSLIEEHLLTAAALVEAAKAGNSTAASAAEKKWYENADEIAAFENSINPNWNKTTTMTMWHDHLKLTKAEAVARLTKNYTADIEAFDQIEDLANMMADSMADGIVKQFPDKFKM